MSYKPHTGKKCTSHKHSNEGSKISYNKTLIISVQTGMHSTRENGVFFGKIDV